MSFSPYLRNDDHGGNLLGRMQRSSIHPFIRQRATISSELILVEWNPPEDRPRLRQALQWPDEPCPCAVLFIEAPGQIHR